MSARQGAIKRSAYLERNQRRFGEITYRNQIDFSIDGQETLHSYMTK